MIAIRNFKNIFSISELRSKIFFTLGMLIITRLGTFIPVVGVNISMLGDYMKKATAMSGFLSYLDIISGGALSQATLFALGIMPYITASIIMQMLGMTVPYLEQLLKEGDYGRKIVNQYTRYLTVILAIMYSSTYAHVLERSGFVLTPGFGFKAVFILSLTLGAVFVMWIGEQISLYGLGNGSSLIIFAGIVSRFPSYVNKTIAFVESGSMPLWQAVVILAVFIAIIGSIIFLEKGERKIPVQYARRVVGQRVYGGQSSYIPFKINTAGVMPVIFATSVLNLPMWISSYLATKGEYFRAISEMLQPTGLIFSALEFVLIVFFSFFYTALVFNPDELAENIKKSGGFIPGIRPGKKTALFFNYILTRIGLVGAIYLGFLALAPTILMTFIRNMPFYLPGTSLLIAVGVALETAAQLESYLIEHRYEGFLTSGRLKGRASR